MTKRIFGSVFNRDKTIEERIAELQKVLSESEAVRRWSKSEAWEDIRKALISEGDITKEIMVSLCRDTGDNVRALDRLWAYQHSLETLISVVESPAEVEQSLFDRLKLFVKIRTETTGLPRPSEETSPEPTST